MVNGGKSELLLMLESKSSMFVLGNTSTADQIRSNCRQMRCDLNLCHAELSLYGPLGQDLRN
jgi:hypothetical protein